MKFTLETATILGAMSTSYWPLEGSQGIDTLIDSLGSIKVVVRPGSQAFGANPNLRFGIPGSLALLGSKAVGLDAVVEKFTKLVPIDIAAMDLGDIKNQPIVVSLLDASVVYGPVISTSLGDGGAGYAPGDTGFFDPMNLYSNVSGAYEILTVAPITGAVVTYAITNGGLFGPSLLPATADTDTSGAGTGFTIALAAGVTQGNGLIEVYFHPEVTRIG